LSKKAKGEALPHLIRRHALINAVKHDGKADIKTVIGRVMADAPEARSKITEVNRLASEIVSEVNTLSLDAQKEMVERIAPEYLADRKKAGKKELPPLPEAVEGKVVTRLAPEPNGYIHLGHAMSFFFNYLYAERYKGILWLRFEDTNPRKEKAEYYNAIREDISWLGIR